MTDDETNNEPQTGDTEATNEPRRRGPRMKPMRAVPSERLGMDAHLAVIQAGVGASRGGAEAISTVRIEQSPGVKTQWASLCMGFLVDFGLFGKESYNYRPTETCVTFARLRNLDENRAKPVLRPLVEKSWWGMTTRSQLEFTPTLAEEALVKELMIESGVFDAKKERAVRVLIDWMDYVGFIERREGQVKLAVPPTGAAAPPSPPNPTPPVETPPVAVPPPSTNRPTGVQPLAPPVGAPPAPAAWVTLAWPDAFNVQIKPNAKSIKILRAAIAQLEAAVAADQEHDSDQES